MTDDRRDSNGRFRPGKSGNPKGRPRGSVGLTEALRRRLAEEGEDGRSLADRLAETLIGLALGGDLKAIQVLADRVEGRPGLAVGDADEPPIAFPRLDLRAK
jgi:hypothetical protein